ncbi:MAG: flagellar biosynthesis protein FlhB [Oceanospirillaceae bacterium]|nr:flagellar biosynthesis protein FlhB [Oceanospirillaceae bacterium]
MAEETGQDKTEDPTPKRLREAREKGDIPRSKELSSTVLLLAAGIAALIFGAQVAQAIAQMMRDNLILDRADVDDAAKMIEHLVAAMADSFFSLFGFFLMVFLAAVLSPVALGGWNFSGQALQPKGSRLNPISGIGRMFSKNALVELFKAIAKFLLVGTTAVFVLLFDQPDIASLVVLPIGPGIAEALRIVVWSFLVISASMIFIALIDVPFQMYSYTEKMKMTLQEVRDEMKNTEGRPEVRGRIRQLQREISQRRMMQDVPEADVVITNPTHYAVALKYSEADGGAPLILAKGSDFIALKIREIAEAYEVPILESPALARALYYNSEIGEEVPVGLYKSVAQVLAYVYQLRVYNEKPSGDEPKAPTPDEIEIPDELRIDETQ